MAENKQTEAILNKTLVLKTIRLSPGISRIQIARKLGLNRSTITHIVNELLNRKLIREACTEQGGSPAGGRKPIGLHIYEKAGALLGVEWQIDCIRYVLLGLAGETLVEKRIHLSVSDVDSLIEELGGIIHREEESARLKIRGIGIGVPGRVDPRSGTILESLPFALCDYPLAARIHESLEIPVLIENDANCFAWGEIQENKSEYKNILCLMLEFHHRDDDTFADQEIGMGLVLNGQVYHGSRYSSGELNGPLVDYGRSKAFLELIERQDPFDQSDSQKADRKIVQDYLHHLFFALAPIISILDPEKIFLGGRFNQITADLTPVLEGLEDFPQWACSSRKEFEVAHGSAGHFMETMFALPLYEEGLKDRQVFWDRVFQ